MFQIKRYILIGVVLVTVSFLLGGWAVYLYLQSQATNSTSAPSPAKKEAESPFAGLKETENVWSQRFLFDFDFTDRAETNREYYSAFDLRSIGAAGEDLRQHPLICEGEKVAPLGSIARSPEGKMIAFLLLSKEERQKNPNWMRESQKYTSGQIYLYNLVSDFCQPLNLFADRNYEQNLAFSPSGKYLAYIFYGLHVYDLEAKKDRLYTVREGSARSSRFITGPLVWNRDSTALYMSVTSFSGTPPNDLFPTWLAKVNLKKAVDLATVKLIDDPQASYAARTDPRYEQADKNEEEVIDLADFNFRDYAKGCPYCSSEMATVYAVDPGEKRVAFLRGEKLVVRNLESGEEKILWRRGAKQEVYGENQVTKVVWPNDNWIFFTTTQEATGSGIGYIWGSQNLESARKLVKGEGNFAVSADGESFVYNFDYFGDYYLPTLEGNSLPSGYESSGHEYNGLAVYNASSGKTKILSGKGKSHGVVLAWF